MDCMEPKCDQKTLNVFTQRCSKAALLLQSVTDAESAGNGQALLS